MNTAEALGLAALGLDIIERVTKKVAAALDGSESPELAKADLEVLRDALASNDAAADAALRARFPK